MEEEEIKEKIVKLQELDETIKQLNLNLASLQSLYNQINMFIAHHESIGEDVIITLLPGVLTRAKIDNKRFLVEIGDKIYEEVDEQKMIEILKKKAEDTLKKADNLTNQINELLKVAKELEEDISKNVQLS